AIRHKSSNNDVLLRSLSDFGVVRRSLNPMTFGQYSYSYEYQLTNNQNPSNVKSKKTAVIENLKLSVTFRDNILYIFSYLLYGRENNLTEEQHTSLETLYEFLKKKMVYMYNLLPILPKLDITDKNQQTSIVLSSLIKNLPSYIQCTAKYLVNELESNRIDLNTLLKSTESETFNYLADIDLNTLSTSKIRNEEMIGYDEDSNITQKALGPVFVKLIYTLQTKKLPLSQELFGLILINLPNLSEDPVLEEDIRYLYDLTRNNIIDSNNWDSIGKDPVGNDAYTLVFSVLTKILNSDVQMVVKGSTSYIYHHLKIITVPTYLDSNLKYMHHLLEKDIDIGMLLSAVIPQEFDEDTIRMKDRLLTYFMRNYKNEDMNKILKGFNKFAYNEPSDLLLAFLTRLITRVPSSPNTNSLQQPASALLSAVFMKKYSKTFTPFVSPEIDVQILLESVQVSDVDEVLQSTIDSIKLELIAQPKISVLLSTLIPTEKEKCQAPKQCLVNTFQQVHKLQNNIPLTLTTKIQNVAYILKSTPQSQQQKESHTTQYSIKPVDVNLYLDRDQDRENSIAVAIKTDNMYTSNVPSSGINGVSYVWNIDKYVGKTGPAVQNELPAGTLGWETGIAAEIDSTETKIVSPTIDQAHITETKVTKATMTESKVTKPKVIQPHITEHVPTQERTSDRPLTLKPLLTTSISNVPSLGTYRPTQKPRKGQPRYTTPIPLERIVEDTNTKVKEYIYVPTSKVIYDEKEEVSQSTSKENSIDKKVHSENVASSAIVLPPTIETDQPLRVQLSTNDVLVVTTTSDHHNTTQSEVVLPDIKELLKSPDINKLMQNTDSPIVTQVLQPLSTIFGKNYVKKILKNGNIKLYPTNVALLSEILQKAITYPEVTQNSQLTSVINRYIVSIRYVSPTTLLPVVVSSKKLVSDVIYSTFNPDDSTHSKISESPPDESLADSVTVPLVNPKILLESINPSNPYVDLLPTLKEGDIFAKTIQPLKIILTSAKIMEILGPDFKPLVYPNKITLLITLLHKLQESTIIQTNIKLKSVIEFYIQAFEIPSTTTQVSEDSFVKMMSETTGQWLPELTSLTSALPPAENDAETMMIEEIEQYLDDLTLLEKLNIAKPPSTTTRGELLLKIIQSSLSGTISIEKSVLKAFRYYEDKIEFTDMGALPIMWMWVETYVFKAEVQLGDMIQETVNFNELSYKEKLAYNDIITYLSQNPNLLQDNEDFDFEKYKTQGQFVKGLFKYLLKKPEVNDKVKKEIQMILPHVTETGAGAVAMPNLSGF
ncbi:hypothetical protein ALC62_13860, partial [Cyphomyrmex costatus]